MEVRGTCIQSGFEKNYWPRLAPKLTRKHIELTQFSKLKVKLATHVFSYTVQAAMLSYICSGTIDSDSKFTAEFIGKMDKLFDCFNSDSLSSTKIFKRPIKPTSPHFDFLNEMFEHCSD